MKTIKINQAITFDNLPEGMQVQNDVHAIVTKREYDEEEATIKITYKVFIDGGKVNDYQGKKSAITSKKNEINLSLVNLKAEENKFKNATSSAGQIAAQKKAVEIQQGIKVLRGELTALPIPNENNNAEKTVLINYPTVTKMNTAKINEDLMIAAGITDYIEL